MTRLISGMMSAIRSRLKPVLAVLAASVGFWAVQQHFPDPYMDEVFHVSQTQSYCAGKFYDWNSKITTPPGLYMLGFLEGCTSLSALRFLNLAALGLSSLLVSPDKSALIMTFPLMAFYSNLYYTDVISTLLVVAGSVMPNALTSSLFFSISLWFRQTNIIWAGFVGFVKLWKVSPYDVRGLWKYWNITVPFTLVAVQFVAYLVWNNGAITLGDQDNHTVSLHFAQILYFFLFTAAFSIPLLEIKWIRWYLKRLASLRVLLEMVTIAVIVQFFTIEHPFILADNRHYTFYLWRRVLRPPRGYFLVPIYHAAASWFFYPLSCDMNAAAFIAAASAVLIPTPLLEPRYYLVPYLLWRLFLVKQPVSWREIGWYQCINSATIIAFCCTKTHFMW